MTLLFPPDQSVRKVLMLVGVAFLLLALVTVFLFFQLRMNQQHQVHQKQSQHRVIMEISKLILMSNTQQHPFLRYNHAKEAELRLQLLLEEYGHGTTQAEASLRLESGTLSALQETVTATVQKAQAPFLQQLMKDSPEFNMPLLNRLSGLSGQAPASSEHHTPAPSAKDEPVQEPPVAQELPPPPDRQRFSAVMDSSLSVPGLGDSDTEDDPDLCF